MTFTPEQKQTISQWVAAGEGLSAIQKKISEQFGASLTFMETRFLVDDLGLDLKQIPKPASHADLSAPAPAARSPGIGGPSASLPPSAGRPAEKRGLLDKLKKAVGGGGEPEEPEPAAPAYEEDEDAFPEDLEPVPAAGGGNVAVELDVVTRPGTVASGTVSFSDGVRGKWALDQYGRLMLDTGKPGYQPGPADVQAFQTQLSRELQKRGY